MKRMTGFFFAGLAALAASAVTLDVARLPAPSFADREVSEDSALPANRLDQLRTFRLEMTFDATPSNNVQVAFGRDNMPADGALAAEETDFIVGWWCGEWFIRPQGLRERYAFPAAVASGTRTLTMEIPVSALGVPRSVTFKDGAGAFVFPGQPLNPVPAWLRTDLWTCLRVTVRGCDSANGTVSARFLPDGTKVFVR